jgi:glycosyltransferase involved in cell wall biosynthesis
MGVVGGNCWRSDTDQSGIELKTKPGLLYFSSHYPGIGGGETYLLELAKGLSAEFRVCFVEAGGNDTLANRITEFGYPLARLKYSLFSARKAALQLKGICERWNIDLIHLNNRRDALLAYYLPNVPKVMTIHTNFFASALGMSQNLRSLIMLTVLRLAKNSIQKYITVTQYSADRLSMFLGLTVQQRVCSIYNGLRLSQTADSLPIAQRRLICSVANIYRNKGLEFLIRALVLLTELPWVCQIVGDGPDRSRLELLVHRHQLQNRIRFTGTLPREEVFEILANSRMIVLPTLYEGFPYSLLEAMSLGVPIITTRVLGLPEIIPEGKNGILVDPRDVRGLADAIHALLIDDEMVASMGREGRRLMEKRFSLQSMVEQTRQVYMEIL